MRPPGSGVLNARRAEPEADESLDELRLRAFAVPLALLIAALFSRSQFGHALQRLFFGMPLHELGHALTAVAVGIPAFPLPWVTPMGNGRSPVLVGLLLGGAAMLVYLGRRAERRSWVVGGASLMGLLLLGQLVPEAAARMLITFAGDAGAMVLGTLLMATVFTEASSPFRRGALRWGLLVIGAAAFSDVASTWLAARRDPGEIPLGELEGVGLSDASKLVETYGWSERALVGRYLWVAGLCLAAIAVLWALRGVRPYLRARE
jgi:hypothetical protein